MNNQHHTGCLLPAPHPTLFRLLYAPAAGHDVQHVLPHLLRIDAAHLVMLAECRLVPRPIAAALLRINDELATRLANGEEALTFPPEHRGLYFVYEQHYIEKLGQHGGSAHLARSRNDINATVARMRMRIELRDLLFDCCELSDAITSAATSHLETMMCAFTHQQPAQPSTLGHYLAGVLAEMMRSAETMQAAFAMVNACPLGAAAGQGTSWPINQTRVASLLGFGGIVENSNDAVASRDYLVHVLGALAILTTALTRLATDLQAWSSYAYGFLDWPDDLVSTSSIMPQKRNAFVFENIRGKAAQVVGSLVNVLMGMKNVPFSNSVEVSAEASACAWPGIESGRCAVRLTTLMLKHLRVQPERMRAFLRDSNVTMTALANFLVLRHGFAFRSAHDAVSEFVKVCPEPVSVEQAKLTLEKILSPLRLDANEVAFALNAEQCVRAAAYGGGPSPNSVRRQLEILQGRTDRLREQVTTHENSLQAADQRLRTAVQELIASADVEDTVRRP